MAELNAVATARSGLDTGLLARAPERASVTARPGPVATSGAAETVNLSRGVSLLAALDARQETMNGIARELRTQAAADAGNQDLTRLPKLYPPYPVEYKERVAYLDRLVGLGKQNDALELPAREGMASESGILNLGQRVASALADRANQGLTRNPGNIVQYFSEGHA